MAKTDAIETAKPAAPAPAAGSKKKKEKEKKPPRPPKQRLVAPPFVEMFIAFARTAFLLIGIVVVLISLVSSADVLTAFVRTMVIMIVAGLLLWLVTWLVTQTYVEGAIARKKEEDEQKKREEEEKKKSEEEGLASLTDIQA